MHEISKAFGQRLKLLRQRKGWSQEELAHQAGIAVSYLSELETGKKEPCLGRMKRLAEGLGMTVSALTRGL